MLKSNIQIPQASILILVVDTNEMHIYIICLMYICLCMYMFQYTLKAIYKNIHLKISYLEIRNNIKIRMNK